MRAMMCAQQAGTDPRVDQIHELCLKEHSCLSALLNIIAASCHSVSRQCTAAYPTPAATNEAVDSAKTVADVCTAGPNLDAMLLMRAKLKPILM
jgi:hypothetical protein